MHLRVTQSARTAILQKCPHSNQNHINTEWETRSAASLERCMVPFLHYNLNIVITCKSFINGNKWQESILRSSSLWNLYTDISIGHLVQELMYLKLTKHLDTPFKWSTTTRIKDAMEPARTLVPHFCLKPTKRLEDIG